jgi:hypothetical protein
MLAVLGPPLRQWNGGFLVRIADDARKSVLFFGTPTMGSQDISYGGTGFAISVEDEGYKFTHLVTARHVANRLSAGFVIRVNLKSGGSELVDIDEAQWHFHPDPDVDVAVTPFLLDQTVYDMRYFAWKGSTYLGKNEWGEVLCGDPVNIVGLFRLHSGEKRNVPIVHCGHVALLPDPHEKIPMWDRARKVTAQVEGYLVEAQTLEGLSGSPVFVRRLMRLGSEKGPNDYAPIVYGPVQLLGLYQGAWDGRPGEILAEDRNLSQGELRVPVGMGVVVPASKILETLEVPDLMKRRKEILTEWRSKRAASMDSAFDNAPPASDENPTHQEDFTRLLGAAARKREPED